MSTQYKVLMTVLVILLGGAFYGGYYYGGAGETKTVTVHDVQTVEKIVDHVVTVTRTVKPDGTITEITKTEDKQDDKQHNEQNSDTSISSNLPDYSLGVRYHVVVGSLQDTVLNPYRGIEINAGRRLLGPIWGEVGIQPLQKDISIGVRIEL